MFSQQLKKWIFDMVSDVYTGDIYQDISSFEKSLALYSPEISLEGVHDILPDVLEEMCNTASLNVLQGLMERFTKVEPYLRHMFTIVYPNRYKKMPKEENNGMPLKEWTLAALLKQAFSIVPMDFDLSSNMSSSALFSYADSYRLIYQKRNDSAHNFSNMKQREIFNVITAGLVVYLDISGRLCFQIEEEFNKTTVNSGFSALLYCQKIVRDYRNNAKQGFSYVDIKWRKSTVADAEYCTVNTMLDDDSNRLIKILGEAGCGKTTIMKQMEYIMAQRVAKKQSDIIPVYIPLIKTEIDSSLHADARTLICRQLDVEHDMLESLLALNSVYVMFDGFNEILDSKLKKQIAWSIDELASEYPLLRICLSDRSLVRSVISVLDSAEVFRLYPLDNHMKSELIKKNCSDAEALNLLVSYFNTNPNYYEKFTTPIKIIQLVEFVSEQKRIPEDFEREYIHFILNRELVEKKDENANYLEDFACALALQIETDEGIPLKKACACLAKCKSVLGYTIPDSLKCLHLMIDIGVLVCEEDIINFKFPEYRDFFWMNAFDNHLADLLE